jgi:hypothetical protein
MVIRLLMALSATAILFSAYNISIITWGYGGISRAHMNVSPDGSINLQSRISGARSAFELRPTLGAPPNQHAVTESVWYLDDDPAEWSRINLSAITDIHGGHYRIGVEHGTDGYHRPLVLAFEGEVGAPCQIPLQLVPNGEPPIAGSITEKARVVVDNNPLPANGTGLWLVFEDDTGSWTYQRVEVGAANSAGTGYRQLRIRN